MSGLINFRIVYKILGINLFILAGALFLNISVAVYYKEQVEPFIYSSLISLILGLVFRALAIRNCDDTMVHRKGAYLAVTLSWVALCFVGCLPYVFSGKMPGFVNAFFESVSGFTTTGASILSEIESLPKSILLWRCLTHWIGGIGIIVLVIIVMPTLNIGSYHLFTLESSLQEKFKPKIKAVGVRLLIIYIALTVGEVIFLLLGKMNLFESVCHAFATVATGGFSPKNTSIADYSPYIQYVIMVFMFLAGTNFVLHYYILKRDFKKVANNEEFKFYLLVTVLIGAVITMALYFDMGKSLEESFRESFFQVISIITCTGFATADYLQWPEYAWVILFFAMFLGGSTGSTAGGIKMARHLILFKNIKNVYNQMLSPNAVLPVRFNKNRVNPETNSAILTFISCYLLVFLIGSIILVFSGLDFQTATSSVATCMAGIGPGIGEVGPASNFANISIFAKLVLTLVMLIGRLEVYTILTLFSRNFWRL